MVGGEKIKQKECYDETKYDKQATNIALQMWVIEFGDMDFSVTNIVTDEYYRNNLM